MGRLTQPYRHGQPAPSTLLQLRRQLATAIGRYPRHAEVETSYRQWGGVRCLVLTPPRVEVRLLYFHGGGFRIGSPELSAGFASLLAVYNHCEVILPFYSLAPERPFPCGLLDGQSVLESVRDTLPLLIGGDSAGGNLAAVLARHFWRRVQGAILISPWLDLRLTADSYQRNAQQDSVFSPQAAREAADLYLQGHTANDPDVSPLLARLNTMPPCCLCVGGGEILLDDALALGARLAQQGRTVALRVWPDMVHVEPTTRPTSPHLDSVLAFVAPFIRECLDGKQEKVL